VEGCGQLHAPAAVPSVESPPGTHWIGVWVGPRAVWMLSSYKKSITPTGNGNPSYPNVVVESSLCSEVSGCVVIRKLLYLFYFQHRM
jgi:hypothetical protein